MTFGNQTPQIAHFALNPAGTFSQKKCLTPPRSPRTLLRPLTGNLHRGKPIWRALDWAIARSGLLLWPSSQGGLQSTTSFLVSARIDGQSVMEAD